MNNVLISIIIPAYNIENYISRCLESVINQTYKNLEIIVVSDGSTDRTDEIIKKFSKKDKRIICVFKKNTGVSDTRNVGLEIATGDYIGFVDGDDCIKSNMYEILLNNALQYNADISHCGYQMVFPSRVDDYYNTGVLKIYDRVNGLKELIEADLVEPGVWNKLYKRQLLNRIRFDKNISMTEDLLFNVYAFNNSSVSVFYDLALYNYMIRENSACTTKELDIDKVNDTVKVIKELDRLVEDKELLNIKKKRVIDTLVNEYRKICFIPKFRDYSRIYRYEIKKQVKYRNTLSKKKKIELFVIQRLPFFYVFFIKFYYRFIYNNKYEVR